MFAKSFIAAAAAATVTAAAMGATASTANAGVRVNIGLGFPGYIAPVHGYGYVAPAYRVRCWRVFRGYRWVRTPHGWKKRPIYRKKCRRIYY